MTQVNRLVTIWVDGGYRGINFMRWVMDTYRWIDSPVLRSNHPRGFKVLPRRWVEITHFWLVLLVSQCGLKEQFIELNLDEVISDYKNGVNDWKSALGQILVYSGYYPEHQIYRILENYRTSHQI